MATQRLHDPADMLLFAKVIEHGSMSAAARALYKPKASISRAVTRLEASLDVLLLERSARKLVLTPVGRVFLTHCQRVAEDIAEAQAAVRQLQGTVSGRLRVASTVVFGRSWLGPMLPTFLAAHPELRMELELTNRTVDPVEEGFDLVIRTNTQTDPSLVVRKLTVAAYTLYASPAYLAQHPPIEVPADLRRHRVIDTFAGAEQIVWEFTRGAQHAAVELRPRLDTNDPILRRDAAASGVGLTLVPSWIGNAGLRSGALVRVLADWQPTRTAPINALWPARRRSSPRLHAFLDFLTQAVSQHDAAEREI